jgi:hypothetical protein
VRPRHRYFFSSLFVLAVWLTYDKDARKKVSALAAHAAKKTDALITSRAGLAPLSSEGKKALDEFERHVPPS